MDVILLNFVTLLLPFKDMLVFCIISAVIITAIFISTCCLRHYTLRCSHQPTRSARYHFEVVENSIEGNFGIECVGPYLNECTKEDAANGDDNDHMMMVPLGNFESFKSSKTTSSEASDLDYVATTLE